MKLLAKGNSKLSKSVGVWNILAGMEVCNRECAGCYAIAEQKRWKGTVLKGRNNRLEASKQTDFVSSMVVEILKSKFTMIRVHGSGEFYSQKYIDDWCKIADGVKALRPYISFYTYTKRDEFDFSELVKRDNFILHKSFVEVSGKKVMNFGKLDKIEKIQQETGGFICPLATDRTGKCGTSACDFCMKKENEGIPILFEAH